MKDIFIPVFTAIVVVLANQLFLEENRKLERKIEFEYLLLREEAPVLRKLRILTHRYFLTNYEAVALPVRVVQKINSATGEVIGTTEEQDFSKADTLRMRVPTFVVVDSDKKEFLASIREIEAQKDLLSHSVFLEFEKVLDFLKRHPIPPGSDPKELLKTTWKEEETLAGWDKLMSNLYSSVVSRMEE